MTPRVKPPHTLVSVLHWLWYCRATALSALANLTLLLGKNTWPFPAFGNLNFVSPPHRRAYTSIPKSCPNIRFPHQQDFFPIRSVTKSSTARFSHENLVEKFKIFVQDFVPIRTALRVLNLHHVFCVFFPSILDIKFVGRTSRGHTGGRSHRIFNPPSFCGACLDFCREKDSAVPFPRRP